LDFGFGFDAGFGFACHNTGEPRLSAQGWIAQTHRRRNRHNQARDVKLQPKAQLANALGIDLPADPTQAILSTHALGREHLHDMPVVNARARSCPRCRFSAVKLTRRKLIALECLCQPGDFLDHNLVFARF
jgi:hypothetical protein